MKRRSMPRSLEREVKVEAGHRCAIPTCRQTPVEIAHIEPWREVREHKFDNLIALCPTCHSRFDKNEIDRTSMHRYKSNLSLLNSRYGDLERRVLQYFADHPEKDTITLFGGLEILLSYLIRDELIYDTGEGLGVGFGGEPGDEVIESHVKYKITEKGRNLVNKWLVAKDLEEE